MWTRGGRGHWLIRGSLGSPCVCFHYTKWSAISSIMGLPLSPQISVVCLIKLYLGRIYGQQVFIHTDGCLYYTCICTCICLSLYLVVLLDSQCLVLSGVYAYHHLGKACQGMIITEWPHHNWHWGPVYFGVSGYIWRVRGQSLHAYNYVYTWYHGNWDHTNQAL